MLPGPKVRRTDQSGVQLVLPVTLYVARARLVIIILFRSNEHDSSHHAIDPVSALPPSGSRPRVLRQLLSHLWQLLQTHNLQDIQNHLVTMIDSVKSSWQVELLTGTLETLFVGNRSIGLVDIQEQIRSLYKQMTIILYGDISSQGTRAVITLLRVGNIQYQFRPVDLMTNGTRSVEFLQLNPFGHVPFLVDGDFKVPESNAILIYLCETHPSVAHLYGAGPKQHARVNTLLSFYQNQFRPAFFQLIYLKKRYMYTQKAELFTPTNEKVAVNKMKVAARVLDSILSTSKYVCGETLTVADFLFFYQYGNVDVFGLAWNFPNVKKWRERMLQIAEVKTVMDEYNKVLPELKEFFKQVQPPQPKL